MGAAFAFTEAVVANQRETDDALNGLAGGCAAGFLAGIRSTFYRGCWIFTRLTPIIYSTLLANSCWFLRGSWWGHGYLRLRRANSRRIRREEGRKAKNIFQDSPNIPPACS